MDRDKKDFELERSLHLEERQEDYRREAENRERSEQDYRTFKEKNARRRKLETRIVWITFAVTPLLWFFIGCCLKSKSQFYMLNMVMIMLILFCAEIMDSINREVEDESRNK